MFDRFEWYCEKSQISAGDIDLAAKNKLNYLCVALLGDSVSRQHTRLCITLALLITIAK